jgi:hypothetical protein
VIEHHSSITVPAQVGPLLRAIEGDTSKGITACALKLAPLVIVRPGELLFSQTQRLKGDVQADLVAKLEAARNSPCRVIDLSWEFSRPKGLRLANVIGTLSPALRQSLEA